MHTLPDYVIQHIHKLDCFVAERAKTARAFLKACHHPKPLRQIDVRELDKHAKLQDWAYLLEALSQGKDVGFMSEAGCPAVADPGSQAVAWTHSQGFRVVPLVGPSSILLALMASGLNGQNFCFQGYLPQHSHELKNKIHYLQNQIVRNSQTQIFIETPYRNQSLFESLVKYLDGNIKLCLAYDLTGKNETTLVMSVKQWRKSKYQFPGKIPCIFLIGQ